MSDSKPTQIPPMVERVARALVAAVSDGAAVAPGAYGFWIKEARAAIAAMREPEPEMLYDEEMIGKASMAQMWRDMIDTALGEYQAHG